jgi:hypothetical protein
MLGCTATFASLPRAIRPSSTPDLELRYPVVDRAPARRPAGLDQAVEILVDLPQHRPGPVVRCVVPLSEQGNTDRSLPVVTVAR